MKRIILTIACTVLMCTGAAAWGRLGHATVARIAEMHLTPEARKAVSEIMHGESIVLYASYADEFKGSMFIDKEHNHPHTFEANMDFEPFRGIYDGDRYVKNCIHFVEQYTSDLRNWREMDDSTRWNELVMMVHFVGDMHCPEHIRYNPEDMTIGYYKVKFRGQEIRYHTLWDDQLIALKYPWSFSDIAHLFDCASEEEIAAITAGGPYDWGRDTARACWPVHAVQPGAELDTEWFRAQLPLLRSQIRNAGYRLAAQLNRIFAE